VYQAPAYIDAVVDNVEDAVVIYKKI